MTENTTTEMTNKDAFSFFDFSIDEAREADDSLLSRPAERDGRICACGHPMARHTNLGGIVLCKPTRMECPCKNARAVLDSDDVRGFLRKTAGGGPMHALGRGVQASLSKGVKVEWIVEMRCDRCKKEGPVSPVPVTKTGFSVDYATGYDALLCADCREAV
jgi:hypothetical protein